MGACSTLLTVFTDQVPTFMNPPQVTFENIDPFWITLNWNAITSDSQTGRDTINFYDLQYSSNYNMPGETWTSLMPEAGVVKLTFNQTNPTGFPSNATVSYRLRAKNGVGYGVFSTVLSF